jgi:ABC-type proline/glycine betaine transport system ATPase subunit
LIISTALTSIIRPNDKVIVLDHGTVLEYGIYTSIVSNPSSYIHTFIQHESRIL